MFSVTSGKAITLLSSTNPAIMFVEQQSYWFIFIVIGIVLSLAIDENVRMRAFG